MTLKSQAPLPLFCSGKNHVSAVTNDFMYKNEHTLLISNHS